MNGTVRVIVRGAIVVTAFFILLNALRRYGFTEIYSLIITFAVIFGGLFYFYYRIDQAGESHD